MRRAVCYIEPNAATAGEVSNWKFLYTTATNLPKKTLLRFDLCSKGRHIDWQIPDTNLKKNSNLIYAVLPGNKIVQAEAINLPNRLVPQFQFQLPQDVPAGQTIAIVLGAPKGQKPETHGNMAQLTTQRRRPFQLFIDPTGKGHFHDPEVFVLDIKGNVLHTVKILAPSFVNKNKRFDVILRFEDEFGNLTSNAPEKTLIELSHGNLRENLKWKLFIPETGYTTLPNLYFNEPGIYTIELKNMHTKELFYSSPIKCFGENSKQLFWGLLHGESERYDSSENIDSALRHFRDEKWVNFYASSPFEGTDETPNELWKSVSQNVEEIDEDERFACFLGFQFSGEAGNEGLRQIVYAKDQKPLLRKKEARSSSLKKIYKLFSPKEIIAIPSFTMGKGNHFNFDDFDPQYERVVEIYNAWGSSECTKEEGNKRPIQAGNKKGVSETKEGSIIKALLANKRFGFVAGGLDDRGSFADLYDGDQKQYSPGLTGLLADQLTKTSLFEALYNRHSFATTGERIILGLSVAGALMGSELDTTVKPGLQVNRHITGFVAGTAPIKSVELIRNGKVLKQFTPKATSFDFVLDDMDPLSSVAVDAKDKKPPFVFYYLRVMQEDGHQAWSSPIWIDANPTKGMTSMVAKASPAKAAPAKAATKPVPAKKAASKPAAKAAKKK